MKFLDFSTLFDGDAAHIAFLSTFQFDPDFFERRLLRCTTLTKARRIVVFLDSGQWHEMLKRNVPARWLNRRYLVVPVHRQHGVFHPKLNLVLTEKGGQIQCGSNNLTRSGCSSNLELLNAVSFEFESECQNELALAREAFGFFRRAAEDTDGEIRRLVTEWTDETESTYPWLGQVSIGETDRSIRLIHTYDGSIWDRLVQHLDPKKPKEFFIISPFHDADAKLCHRLTRQWPHAKVELLVQQNYTNLLTGPLRSLPSVQLSEIRDSSRRIHAKLIAWRTDDECGCFAGSANFTSAAFDGRNVESCLLMDDANMLVDSLFDKVLAKRPLAIDDFVPGMAEEPSFEDGEPPSLTIESALLVNVNSLRVSYSVHLEGQFSSLRLTIRTPGESHPRASFRLPKMMNGNETVLLPDNTLADTHGTLLATLVADGGNGRTESDPVWIIQENRLTHELSEGSTSSKSNIEESGNGLAEYLDELGKRDGIFAVVEYLQHLNIRFHDGGGGPGQGKFRLRIRDPFHSDTKPDWLVEATTKTDDLAEAIYDFVDRHEKRRLRKHAQNGNINGMQNFLDIFMTMVRLLYVYYKREVVKRGILIGRLCKYLELATSGIDDKNDVWDGYLYSTYDNLGGDVELLQEVCDETNYLPEIRAVLLIAQKVRYIPDEQTICEPPPKRLKDVLRRWADLVTRAVVDMDLREPSAESVRKALEAYHMFSEQEIDDLLKEI